MFRSIRALGLTLSLVALAACDKPQPDTQTSTTSVKSELGKVAAPVLSAAPSAVASAIAPSMVTPWDAKLDPDMKAVIDELTAMSGKPIETLSADDARKQPTPTDAVKKLLTKLGKPTTPEEVGKVEDRTIALDSGKLKARVYTPKGKGPFPIVVFYHGGGWVIADNDVYDASGRALANAVNAVVVSPEYRKAPENKFPAAHDDAFAAYQWVLKNAAQLNGDAKKVAVAGESAGGNMAINVSIMARDKSVQLPLAELLVYPVASNDMSSASEKDSADAKPLNHAMMGWFTDKYFKTPADANDPRINVVAANLKGLPPTTIINAEVDPLRSDGELLAQKLKAAGVPVEQKTYPGVTHEFFGMAAVVQKAKDAQTYGAGRLKSALGG